jgi:hypothetical protein
LITPLKALEERTKVEQARAMPQRKQGAYKMADVIVGAVLLWLILGSDIQPAGSNYTCYAKQALDLQDQDQRDINRIERDKDPIRRYQDEENRRDHYFFACSAQAVMIRIYGIRYVKGLFLLVKFLSSFSCGHAA